jgi:hypothetical protein
MKKYKMIEEFAKRHGLFFRQACPDPMPPSPD